MWWVFGVCFAVSVAVLYVYGQPNMPDRDHLFIVGLVSAVGVVLCCTYWIIRYWIPARLKKAVAIFVGVLASLLALIFAMSFVWDFLTTSLGLGPLAALAVILAFLTALFCAVFFSRKKEP